MSSSASSPRLETAGAAVGSPPDPGRRRFTFERDTFAFPNEVYWAYRVDPATGGVQRYGCDPRPTYAHHCFVLARSARQFFYHARFDEGRGRVNDAASERLVREVTARNPRVPCPPARQVVIPGYASLREFSRGRARVLKRACGGAWQSYFLRSHWRMILPVLRWQEAWVAPRLVRAVREGRAPIVHLVRFPQLTINHGIVLYEVTEEPGGHRFTAYDPNLPEHPARLVYETAKRTFFFPANHYWIGGRVDVFQIFHNWLY